MHCITDKLIPSRTLYHTHCNAFYHTPFNTPPINSPGVDEFIRILNEFGVPCTPRTRRGIDIDAGCGQLKAELLKRIKGTRKVVEEDGSINNEMVIDGGVVDASAICSSSSNSQANKLADVSKDSSPTLSSLSSGPDVETDIFVSLDVEAERLLTFNDIESNK